MIHLDANVLIRLSVPNSGAAKRVRRWLLAGETLATSSPAWFEFISGPVSESEVFYAESVLVGGIVDFSAEDAHRAASLFNATGRKRASKLDCMIAASALQSEARVATTNASDFQAFVPEGLLVELVPV